MLFLYSVYFAYINFHSVLAYAGSLRHQAPTWLCRDVYVVGGAARERILLGCVLSQCGSLAACTGRTIIVAKELFITVLPQQDSWGRMLVLRLLFHVHTSTYTAAASRFNERRTLFWHKSWGFFSQGGHLYGGKKENSANHSPSTPQPKA